MKAMISTAVATIVMVGGFCAVNEAQTHDQVIQALQGAQWGPAPPMLPAGAKIAILAGDPTKAVLYAIRLKFPAHYSIPAHSHPHR